MTPANCLNCDAGLLPGTSFCAGCGQRTIVHRITLKHFGHEFFHAFTHTDKGIFHLLKSLATHPGSTARAYILGKRKSYFNPFTFFLILMGLFVLSNNLFGPAGKKPEPGARVLENMPSPQAKAKYVGMISRVNKVKAVFQKNGNVVAMIAVPFISVFSWLFFRKRGFNYAEHLTANMMFIAFSNLVFTLLVFPTQAVISSGGGMFLVVFAGMVFQVLYLSWSLNGFLQLTKTGEKVKSFAVSLFSIVLWAVFSIAVMAIYIYQSRDFYQFFLKMKG